MVLLGSSLLALCPYFWVFETCMCASVTRRMMGNKSKICQLPCSSSFTALQVILSRAFPLWHTGTFTPGDSGGKTFCSSAHSWRQKTAQNQRWAETPAVAHYLQGSCSVWYLLLTGAGCKATFCRNGKHFCFIPKTAWDVFWIHFWFNARLSFDCK